MTVRLNVRGNSGTQILQACAALASLPENSEPIICVNQGGYLNYDASNKLNQFFNPKIRIIEVDTMFKTPYWETGVARNIFTNREKIFRWLEPKQFPTILGFNAVHIRTGDKQICSNESYKRLIEFAQETSEDRVLIFTNNNDYVTKELNQSGANVYSGNVFEDYCHLLSAPVVWGVPTSFLMSMLIFNPKKIINVTGDSYNDGEYNIDNDMIFVREAMEFCPNLRILD